MGADNVLRESWNLLDCTADLCHVMKCEEVCNAFLTFAGPASTERMQYVWCCVVLIQTCLQLQVCLPGHLRQLATLQSTLTFWSMQMLCCRDTVVLRTKYVICSAMNKKTNRWCNSARLIRTPTEQMLLA